MELIYEFVNLAWDAGKFFTKYFKGDYTSDFLIKDEIDYFEPDFLSNYSVEKVLGDPSMNTYYLLAATNKKTGKLELFYSDVSTDSGRWYKRVTSLVITANFL